LDDATNTGTVAAGVSAAVTALLGRIPAVAE
jgi:hypothetical protein